MTNISRTIVFFGSGPVAAASLASLAESFNVEAVITKPVPPHHRIPAPVESLAKKLTLPLFFAATRGELDTLINSVSFASKVGVIVDHGVIVSQKVINTFPLGIVNSHFSLLPQWRGADPITFSLLSGQEKTGVSLMVIEPSLDTGKLITQKVLHITPDDTAISLTDKLVKLSNQLLSEYLPKYIDGEITPKNQPHPDRATFSRKLTKADGIIDPSKTADELKREIRAFIGWPKSRTNLLGHDVIITKAHVARIANTSIDILASDGNYLVIDEIIAPSGKKMTAHAFLNGYSVV